MLSGHIPDDMRVQHKVRKCSDSSLAVSGYVPDDKRVQQPTVLSISRTINRFSTHS
jgi:hypothetical protein